MAHLNFPPPTDHQAFERLLEDIAPATLRADSAHVNGRSGQAQAGVDVNVRTQQGEVIGIQCKLTTGALKLATVTGEIEKARGYKPSLDRLIVATTADTDAGLQEDVRNLPKEDFEVDLWFWPYINNQLNRSPGAALDYAQQVLVGAPGDAEKEHAKHLQVAIDRPAFLHDEHHERSFNSQGDAVKDTLKFLKTGVLYTRDEELVGALPFRHYEDKYAKKLEQVIKAVERMDRHLSTNRQTLLGPPSAEFTRASSTLQILRLDVIDKVNAVLLDQGLTPIEPST